MQPHLQQLLRLVWPEVREALDVHLAQLRQRCQPVQAPVVAAAQFTITSQMTNCVKQTLQAVLWAD